MKILLISPGIDNEFGKYILEANKYRMITPMLTMPYLAALTPPEIEVEIIDEIHGLMTEFIKADLVGITGMTMHAQRMYWMADTYRAMGIPVILGGIHVSYMPEEAAAHADAVVVGEADDLWPELVKDFQAGQLKQMYRCLEHPTLDKLPFPRLDLVDGPRYRGSLGSLNAIMATRGCPHSCIFCCVSKMFGRKFRVRPIESIIAEIEQMNDAPIFFADDNLIGNPTYAKELLTAMIPLKRKWGAQVSIKIADDPELLNLARESGCRTVFIGIESLNPENIVFVNKKMVNVIEKYSDSIKKIHDQGMRIFGSFIVGLDNDDENVFEQIYHFIEKNNIDYPLVGNLTPFPGTELYKMFQEEGRIIDCDWNKYNFSQVVFQPKRMTPVQLQNGYNNLYNKVNQYSINKTVQRARMNRAAAYSF